MRYALLFLSGLYLGLGVGWVDDGIRSASLPWAMLGICYLVLGFYIAHRRNHWTAN